jgi:hypothetical protein
MSINPWSVTPPHGASSALLFQTSTADCGVEIHTAHTPATNVLCGAQGIPRVPKNSPVGDPFVYLQAAGHPHPVLISQLSFETTHAVTLHSGAVWSRLGVTCRVTGVKVRCVNGAGHGFTIGNGHYAPF